MRHSSNVRRIVDRFVGLIADSVSPESIDPQPLCSIPLCMKAIPRMEGTQRVIFIEPSTEATDLEGERVLREALIESKDYFLSRGNLDIEHHTLRSPSPGIPNPRIYEIGRPVEVRFDTQRTYVKGLIYKGAGEMAQQANQFWESITELDPPMRFFPSVGGHVRESGKILVNGGTEKVTAIKRVLWSNVALSREPVNESVPPISVLPIGAFAKSWVGTGSHLHYTTVGKALTAGYGSDVADLHGGAALRTQSLDPHLHTYQAHTQLIHDMEIGNVRISGDRLVPADLLEHLIEHMGLSHRDASDVLRKFLYMRLITRKSILTGESV